MQKGEYIEVSSPFKDKIWQQAEEHLVWAFSNTLKDSLKMRRWVATLK